MHQALNQVKELFKFQARVGDLDAEGNFGSLLTINTECGTSGVGPEDISLACPTDTRGRFVTLQRTRVEFDLGRPYLVVNEVDILVGIEN